MKEKVTNLVEQRKPAISGLKEDDPFRGHIAEVSKSIADKAYELFCQRGCDNGHDFDDWLSAERELFRHTPCEIADKGNELMVRVEAPGFNQRELQIKMEPERIYISGHRERTKQSSSEGTSRSERDYRDIFRTMALPKRVNPEKVTVNLHEGILTIFVQKADQQLAAKSVSTAA